MTAETFTVIRSTDAFTDRYVADIVAISEDTDEVIAFRRRSEVSDLAEGRAQERGFRSYDGYTSGGVWVTITTHGPTRPTSAEGGSFSATVISREVRPAPVYINRALDAVLDEITR
jgi:hypothetical protein